jgi:hypothetical protein
VPKRQDSEREIIKNKPYKKYAHPVPPFTYGWGGVLISKKERKITAFTLKKH